MGAKARARARVFARILIRDGDLCAICRQTLNFEHQDPHFLAPTLDHIIPRSKGGSNRLENLQLAHKSCNERRGNDWGVYHPPSKEMT